MGLPNPLQVLIFPFVFVVALPLALCAGFTSILAFLVLFLRLFLVYLDVGLETLRIMVLGNGQHGRQLESPSVSRRPSALVTPSASPPSTPEEDLSPKSRRRRQRKGSICSGTATPRGGFEGLALTPSTGLDRDFEGIGGWRLQDGANLKDEQTWEGLNSRLEIPDRHHQRSHSGGAILAGAGGVTFFTLPKPRGDSTSPKGVRATNTASPNSSRSRTPTRVKMGGFTSLDNDPTFGFYGVQPPARKVGV